MPTLSPEQALFLLNAAALPSLKSEHPVTRNVIGAIPAERSDFRPDGISRSALDLAWHIAASEIRFLDAVVSGVFNFGGAQRPEAIRAPADIVAWYAEEFSKQVDRLRAASGETLAKVIDFRGLFQLPAVSFVQIGLSHAVHHRGQLSMYLRPMGARVPSIYGESYDARQAREKAQLSARRPVFSR